MQGVERYSEHRTGALDPEGRRRSPLTGRGSGKSWPGRGWLLGSALEPGDIAMLEGRKGEPGTLSRTGAGGRARMKLNI